MAKWHIPVISFFMRVRQEDKELDSKVGNLVIEQELSLKFRQNLMNSVPLPTNWHEVRKQLCPELYTNTDWDAIWRIPVCATFSVWENFVIVQTSKIYYFVKIIRDHKNFLWMCTAHIFTNIVFQLFGCKFNITHIAFYWERFRI